MNVVLGIDVGGSSVKGAPVDLTTGELIAPVLRFPTPMDSTPDAVAGVVGEIAAAFGALGSDAPIGLAVPAPVRHGCIPFIANLSNAWTDLLADLFFSRALGRSVVVVNDADAAGLAEARFGAGRGRAGLVLVTTLGTGIGTAIIHRGSLIPNSELGHLELLGHDAETRAAASVKDRESLSYERWVSERLQPYYQHLEMLFSPDLFVVGGAVSSDWNVFGHQLLLRTPIVPAELRGEAGIVGAALAAGDMLIRSDALPARERDEERGSPRLVGGTQQDFVDS